MTARSPQMGPRVALTYPKSSGGTSLVVQWLRLHASVQEARVQSLVRELDSTCCNQEVACHN